MIWYKRDSEILNQTDRVKSYKIQLFFENGKSVKDYTVLPINISNVDLYIKENIDLLVSIWMQRCKNVKICMSSINVVI